MNKKSNDITKTELRDILKADRLDSEEESVDCMELINKYGTYEIQPTSDTSNVFPMICQGLSDDWQMDKPKNNRK